MHGVGKEVIEIWAILGPKWPQNENLVDPDRKNEVFKKRIFRSIRGRESLQIAIFLFLALKIAHISITFLPTPILFWHIRAIQTPNHPNMAKYGRGW